MLEPAQRSLFLTALEPPDGFRFDYAIATTFSLDLVTLLTAPLAFTAFDRAMSEGTEQERSLELLASLRRYARQITLFCQAGRIAIPRAKYPQFASLERSVIECRVERGLFHPKVWVLRYVGARGEVRYRLLCLSRNLTIANSWDTLLSLEGEPESTTRSRVIDPRPLADFVAALPSLARDDVSDEVVARTTAISGELRGVAFVPPTGFNRCEFHHFGIGGQRRWPFSAGGGSALVISPFVSASTLERIARGRTACTLVSSPEALVDLPSRPAGFSQFWTLDDDALADLPPGVDEAEFGAEDEIVQLTGLHAKAYIFEDDGKAEIWTGSANATEGAFGGNVEFMVRLAGTRERVGIGALMTASKESVRLIDVLKDAGHIVAAGRDDEVQRALESRVERIRNWVGGLQLRVVANPRGEHYDLVVETTTEPATAMPNGGHVTCWPVMVGESYAKRIEASPRLATFESVTLAGVSAFLAFKVVVRENEVTCEARFVLNVPLFGAPEDREESLLRSLIGDRSRLVRFMTLLLSDDGSPPEPPDGTAPSEGSGGSGESSQDTAAASGMFELLVRALERAPERLDDIARLVDDLRGKESQDIFPEHFDAIWQPIWAARCYLRQCAKS
jgi:hypothetical protein